MEKTDKVLDHISDADLIRMVMDKKQIPYDTAYKGPSDKEKALKLEFPDPPELEEFELEVPNPSTSYAQHTINMQDVDLSKQNALRILKEKGKDEALRLYPEHKELIETTSLEEWELIQMAKQHAINSGWDRDSQLFRREELAFIAGYKAGHQGKLLTVFNGINKVANKLGELLKNNPTINKK